MEHVLGVGLGVQFAHNSFWRCSRYRVWNLEERAALQMNVGVADRSYIKP